MRRLFHVARTGRVARVARVARVVGLPLGLFLALLPCRAEITLPAVFSDHAVLQKSARTPVWGKAAPGEEVQVSLGTVSASARADETGAWRVILDLSQSSSGPFDMSVSGSQTRKISDVIVGEVWLASGQSNMAWTVRDTTGAKEEIASSANPSLRHFQVKKNATADPASDLEGEWRLAGPATTGRFTAVGYYFAKALNRELHCPVGIIHSSWGGTPVEAWTSVEGLKHDPELSRAANRIRENKSAFPQTLAAYAEQFSSWSKQYERGDRPVLDANAAFAMEPSNVDWKPISIPSNTPAELPKAGAIWFRRTFTIPAEAANLQQPLYLGKIRGFYKAYLNGEKIAEVNPGTGNPAAGPVYLKPNLVRKGPAVLAIRIFNPSAPPILEPARPLRFMGQDLSGSWTFCEDGALPPLSGEGLHAMPKMPDQPPQDRLSPSYLYNAMIAPLVPYGIRGIIWYQGESNASRGWQYRTAFPLLIEDWRSKWDEKDLPFYYCQLANNGAKKNVPTDSGWADLREAQSLALRLPNTGQAILIDAGEADDIHWRNKVIAGERLARIALANSYGKSMDFSGPVYQSSRLEEGRITIVFSKVKGRLKAAPLPETYQPRSTLPQSVPLIRNSPESELEGFAICGEDRKWVWAQARIEGNTVVVWSPQVKRPVAVRYAWATNPTCNLTDDSGLPAGPFRTDDFPLMTRHSRY